jgi:uncharacterized membrane protein
LSAPADRQHLAAIVPQNDHLEKEEIPMQILARFRRAPSGKRRIVFLDELRGLGVCAMVVYHGLYTFAVLFEESVAETLLRLCQPLEPLFAALFIVLSGIACQLSRSNLKRGAYLAVVAAVVSAVTILVTPEQPIYFGILHLLSCAMMLTGLLLPYLNRLPIWPSIAVCGVVAVMTYRVWDGYLGIFTVPVIPLPDFLYQNNFLCWLGFYGPTFFSADYFPLLPWLFVFLGGVFFGRYAKDGDFPPWTYRSHVPFFSFCGRHALVIYLVHQPVFYGIGQLLRLL